MRNLPILCAATLLVGALAVHAQAESVTLTASADTYISNHSALGLSNTNHDTAPILYSTPKFAPGPGGDLHVEPIVQFDLSAFDGQTITTDGTFEMYVFSHASGYFHNEVRNLRVGRIDQTVDTTTITDATFNHSAVTWLQTVGILWNSNNPRYIQWTIPQAVLQGWVDSPSTNNGLILQDIDATPTFFHDLAFTSLESNSHPLPPNDLPPQLSFGAVPEPSSVALFGLGAVGLVARRRRMRRALASRATA